MSQLQAVPPSIVLPELLAQSDAMRVLRRDTPAHPELCSQEERTSEMIARTLAAWGIEVHRGLGKTGVVGVIQGRPGPRSIGLRADIDALPMTETTGLPLGTVKSSILRAQAKLRLQLQPVT